MTDESAQEIVDRLESSFNLAARDTRTHYHPIYAGLHCGATTGIHGGKDKEIDCPKCRANFEAIQKAREEKMDLDLYMLHYGLFNDEFFPQATVEDIEDKFFEEVCEFQSEYYASNKPEMIAELIDVMNMSIKLLTAYGVKNVLHAGYLKLQTTAKKYRETAHYRCKTRGCVIQGW